MLGIAFAKWANVLPESRLTWSSFTSYNTHQDAESGSLESSVLFYFLRSTSTDNSIQDHFKSFRLKPGYVARRFGNKEGMCCKVLGISDSYPAKTFYIKRFQLLPTWANSACNLQISPQWSAFYNHWMLVMTSLHLHLDMGHRTTNQRLRSNYRVFLVLCYQFRDE